MTEANPPDKLSDLGRRILFLLKEKDRRGDYPYLSDIAKDLGETPEDIKDQLDIMKDLGLAEVTFFIGEDAQPFITGTGKLKLEQWGQATPVTDSPPISETSLESPEFRANKDYSVVIWRGKEYFLTDRQAECVRLLHEAHTDGTRWLSGPDILRKIAPSPKGIVSIRMSDIFKDSPAWIDGLVIADKRGFYRLNL